ncbi:MAG TPA: hypothetical protein VFP72_04455 [Kineosporiaceae bacterium]|nr:hypothetical protein [Kineosporiaceae bacterium]
MRQDDVHAPVPDEVEVPLIVADRTGSIGIHHSADVTFGFGEFAEGLYPLSQHSFAVLTRGRFDLTGSGGWRALQFGKASGRLLGGDLKGLASLAGTPVAEANLGHNVDSVAVPVGSHAVPHVTDAAFTCALSCT